MWAMQNRLMSGSTSTVGKAGHGRDSSAGRIPRTLTGELLQATGGDHFVTT